MVFSLQSALVSSIAQASAIAAASTLSVKDIVSGTLTSPTIPLT